MVLIVLVIILIFWFRNLKTEFEGFDPNKVGQKGDKGDQGPAWPGLPTNSPKTHFVFF